MAAVDILDSILNDRHPTAPGAGRALFRALAVKAAYPTEAVRAADPAGHLASYGAERLATAVRTEPSRPILIPHVGERDLARIARDAEPRHPGPHQRPSYLLTPLIARGEVVGTLGLTRARNPLPFDNDDLLLAGELADRAAVCIDNARLYQGARNTAVTLQRSLLPNLPPQQAGLDIASRYRPAGTTIEVGGDWFDVIPLAEDKTALVVGDVMGSGISAATTMGRLRTATSTLADLNLPPTELLHHLDKITADLEQYATCAYAIYDPHRALCHIAVAGHLPPVLMRTGEPPELLELPTGAPLGVGGVAFEVTTPIGLAPGDQLVLYTDGLVETRHHAIDERLDLLLQLLHRPDRSSEETCDRLLDTLRDPDDHDDVAVLIAEPDTGPGPSAGLLARAHREAVSQPIMERAVPTGFHRGDLPVVRAWRQGFSVARGGGCRPSSAGRPWCPCCTCPSRSSSTRLLHRVIASRMSPLAHVERGAAEVEDEDRLVV